MRKRLLITATVAALALSLVPGSANATGEGGATAVVAVFTGNASVTPGLCIPGNAPGCVGPAAAGYNFTIPGDPAPMPAVCQAAGLFETLNAAGGCDLIANGTLGGITTPEPACGNATGASSATETNTVTFAGQTRTHSHSFLTTAGSVVPVTGNIDDADADATASADDHQVIALVQAFPVTAAGTIPCFTTPAETFIAVGIAVAA